nr:MAG: hypothetical protein DIU57_03270 [Pseudomonadota bacterium]
MNVMRWGVTSTAVIAACMSLVATPATAADFGGPPPRYEEPPAYEAPVVPIWQGLYGGVHLGYIEDWDDEGVLGGAQLGYNWQADRFVVGVEGDLSAADTSVDWLASIRGRAGFLLDDRLLAYGTAGVGFVDAFDDAETDFVWGVGLEGKLSDTMSARVEYLSYDDFDIDVIRGGLNFKLGY